MSLTASQVLEDIESLPEKEKDTLAILLDEKIASELRFRMNLDQQQDISENELFG